MTGVTVLAGKYFRPKVFAFGFETRSLICDDRDITLTGDMAPLLRSYALLEMAVSPSRSIDNRN